uniref:Anthranilate synthase component I N-terminal domain-containing protein n=1 Tax=Kalanchoe fedtschenkoi TaxID=63787 RepID=A0A7N0U497_KALFE
METLAVKPRLLPCPRAKPPPPTAARHSLTFLTPPRSRLRTLQCSALSSSSSTSVDHSARFFEACKEGNLVPLYRNIFSDHLTPVLAYRCLVKEDDREAPSFLFESVEPGLNTSGVGRYSVIGAQPTIEIVAKENYVTVMDHEEGRKTEEIVDDPMVVPRRIMEGWKPQRIDELPEAFCGNRNLLILKLDLVV